MKFKKKRNGKRKYYFSVYAENGNLKKGGKNGNGNPLSPGWEAKKW
jgi:hypothetical protein